MTAWLLLGLGLTALFFRALTYGPFYEGDDAAIALGMELQARHGRAPYHPDFQPAVYALHRLLGSRLHLDAVETFGLLAAAAMAAGGVATFALARRCGVPRAAAIAAFLLFPEAAITGLYLNTTSLAAGAVAVAFAAAGRAGDGLAFVVASAMALAVGIWCRADALLMMPACALFVWRGLARSSEAPATVRHFASATACLVAVSVGLAGALYLVAGADIFSVPALRHDHLGRFSNARRTVTCYRIAYPLAGAATAILGSVVHLRRGDWLLCAAVLAACVPLLVAYGTAVSTPKYLVYSLVPLIALSGSGIAYLVRRVTAHRRQAGGWIVLAGVGALCAIEILPLGPSGAAQSTHDGDRHLFARLADVRQVLREKRYWRDDVAAAVAMIGDPARRLIVAPGWLAENAISYRLIMQDFTLEDAGTDGPCHLWRFERGQRELYLASYDVPGPAIPLGPRAVGVLGAGSSGILALLAWSEAAGVTLGDGIRPPPLVYRGPKLRIYRIDTPTARASGAPP